MPGRRYNEFVELLEPFDSEQCAKAKNEVLGEVSWNKLRLIIAHDPVMARSTGDKRASLIRVLEKKAGQWTEKLDAQELGKKAPGRKTSDGGARARFYRAVSEAHLSKIILVDLRSELFTWRIDERGFRVLKNEIEIGPVYHRLP